MIDTYDAGTYDAGYLPNDEDCDQDSIRVELAYSHDFYSSIIESKDERIAELENQWISVEDRLPEIGRVLAIGNGCESEIVVFLAFAKGGGKFKAKGRDCSDLVTHWMPLPLALKEQGE